MPQRNTIGGKAYKKNKKGLGTNDKDGGNQRFTAKAEGQDYGRVTRLLGNRRVMCFCNDGLDRVCKIRGGICRGSHNKQKIEIGDIVLISYRDYEGADSEDDDQTPKKVIAGKMGAEGTEAAAVLSSGKKDIADILMKYDRSHWRDIRKEDNINGMLFPMTSNTITHSGDDIFEDVDESMEDSGPKIQHAPGKEKGKVVENSGFLDDEDLVIDDI